MTKEKTQQIAAATVTVVIIIIGIAVLLIVFRRRIIRIKEKKTESDAKNQNTVQTGAIVRLPGILLRQGSDLFATLSAADPKNKVKPKFVPCEEHPGQLKVVNLPPKTLTTSKTASGMRGLQHSTAHFTSHTAASRNMSRVMPECDIGVRDMEAIPDLDDEIMRSKRITHRPIKTPFTDGPRVNNLTS